MKWIAASIFISAVLLAYVINIPFRACVDGYLTIAKNSDAFTRASAAMTCQVKRS